MDRIVSKEILFRHLAWLYLDGNVCIEVNPPPEMFMWRLVFTVKLWLLAIRTSTTVPFLPATSRLHLGTTWIRSMSTSAKSLSVTGRASFRPTLNMRVAASLSDPPELSILFCEDPLTSPRIVKEQRSNSKSRRYLSVRGFTST